MSKHTKLQVLRVNEIGKTAIALSFILSLFWVIAGWFFISNLFTSFKIPVWLEVIMFILSIFTWVSCIVTWINPKAKLLCTILNFMTFNVISGTLLIFADYDLVEYKVVKKNIYRTQKRKIADRQNRDINS